MQNAMASPQLEVNPNCKDFAFFCSPLRDMSPIAMRMNMAAAVYYSSLVEKTKMRGLKIIAPHTFLPAEFDDHDTHIRNLAMNFNQQLIEKADYLVVFSHTGVITNGMVEEIGYALYNEKRVIFSDIWLFDYFKVIHPELVAPECEVMTPILTREFISSYSYYTAASIEPLRWYVSTAFKMAAFSLKDADRIIQEKSLIQAYSIALDAVRRLNKCMEIL